MFSIANGFVEAPIAQDINLIEEIKRLKTEKNALLLAHLYVRPELQDIADFTGDSLGLAQNAAHTNADIIVFIGVHFMGETAKILNPDKKVIVPDLNAGCSLADSAPPVDFALFKAKHPKHKVISYINCSAEIKALSDVICTSSNAMHIVNSFPADQPLIFAPDKNLGDYLNRETGREMVLWDGACMVHEKYSLEGILQLKAEHPDAEIISHPECERPILIVSDYIGSTTALLKYARESKSEKFIVVTESGILHRMQRENPNKILIPAPGTDQTCACNDCAYMKLNTLEKVYLSLLYEQPTLEMDAELLAKAKLPIERMLEISKSIKN